MDTKNNHNMTDTPENSNGENDIFVELNPDIDYSAMPVSKDENIADAQPESAPEEVPQAEAPAEQTAEEATTVQAAADAEMAEEIAPQVDTAEETAAQEDTAEEEMDPEYKELYEKYYNKRSFGDVVWHDRKKRTRAFFIIVLILLVLFAAVFGFVYSKLSLIDFQHGDEPESETSSLNEQIIYDEDDYEMMSAIESASSLKDYLYKWANNDGQQMESKNVINVLLLGLDSYDGLQNGGRSDVNMLLSLNKKTKTINISSIYRDTWTYMNVDGTDRYSKINAAYFYGGPDGIVQTIEKNFKVDIDFYVAVDFSSFTDIINAMGGITLEVQEYEAKYINRTTVHNIEYGEAVTLDGYEALVFARIRKSDSDSDLSRTRRQRQVITALIDRLKTASPAQINSAITTLLKYVKTDLTKTQIVTYASQAVAFGWMNYDITETVLSDSDVLGTGYVGTAAAVFMDFPLAANRLQTAIYGDSNIDLPPDRATIFDLVR